MTFRPKRAAVAELVQRLEPGARLVSVRTLKGGTDASTQRVDFETNAGARGSVVLRCLYRHEPEKRLARGWQTLEFIRPLPFPVPAPLLLDREGSAAGVPAMVMSLLPGRTWVPERHLDRWVDELAETLAALHDAPLPREGAPRNGRVRVWDLDEPPDLFGGNRLAKEIWPLMVEQRPAYDETPEAFCHIDFWPGNVLFSRGRLTGVVDWSRPGFLPYGYDVAFTALDLTLGLGASAGERFVRTYEAASGREVHHFPAWALAVATRAVLDTDVWAAAYRQLGRAECTNEVVEARLHEFIAEARRRLGR